MSFLKNARFLGLLTFLSMAVLVGCSSAEDAAIDSLDVVHTAATLNGTWRGADGTEGPASLHFEQRGLSASATLTLTRHRCVERIALVGEVDSDGFAGTAEVGAMRVRYRSKPDISELLADFESVQSGPCPGEKGNVRLFR